MVSLSLLRMSVFCSVDYRVIRQAPRHSHVQYLDLNMSSPSSGPQAWVKKSSTTFRLTWDNPRGLCFDLYLGTRALGWHAVVHRGIQTVGLIVAFGLMGYGAHTACGDIARMYKHR